MRLDGFTTRAREALEGAGRIAQERGNPEVEVEHLVRAIVGDPDGVVRTILNRLEVGPDGLLKQIDALLDRLPSVQGGETAIGRRLNGLIPAAEKEARTFGDEFVGTETCSSGPSVSGAIRWPTSSPAPGWLATVSWRH